MASSNLARGQPQVPDRVTFIDFAPDEDPITPGILLDCSNMVPTQKGFRTYPAMNAYSSNALPSACLGAWAGYIGAKFIIVAGIVNQLYQLTDQQFVSEGLTLLSTNGRWRFDTYGNDLIGVDGVNPPQVKTGAGSFGALGGSPPVASIVQATDYSIFLIVVNSRTWWSTLSDTVWTAAIATQTVTGNLDSSEGNITAAHRLRSGIALYKARALHSGFFIGPPFYWEFRTISKHVGVLGQESVANLGDFQYFPGTDDFYRFDGYTLERIPNRLKEWFFNELDGTNADKIVARWDSERSLIFWHFPSTSASPIGSLNRWICYNVRTGRWTADTAPTVIDTAFFTPLDTGGVTYGSFTRLYPSYGAIPSTLTYGDTRSRTVPISAVIKASDHKVYIYDGDPASGFLTTGDFGDRHNMYQVTRVRPEFALRPASGATLQPLTQANPGSKPVAGSVVTMSSDDWFNFRKTARLQRFKITGNSEMEMTGLEAMIEYAGER